MKFQELNYLFSEVHNAVAHSLPVAPDHVGHIQRQIDKYLAYYRENFPNKILPKHHILEDHTPTWINRWEVGMALHGEQGGESVHSEFNSLQRAACGIRNELDQLMAMMRDHHMKCSPTIQECIVEPKCRKKGST